MKIKIWVSGISIALLGLGLAGCGSQTKSKQKTLNVTATQAIATADPDKADDIVSQAAIAQFMEGLYTTNQQGKIIPAIAKKVVKPTNGGKTYTFELRHNAKWANGRKVTAADFVYSLQRQVDPKTKSQEVGHVAEIKNATAITAGKKAVKTLGVKALGKYKLKITLAQRVPYFNYRLATEIYPLNKQFTTRYGNKYGTTANKTLSNGPYVLKGWNGTNDTWKYVKNPYYYGHKQVHIKQVKVQTVKNNSTAENLFESNAVQVTQITGTQVASAQQGSLKNQLKITKLNQLYFMLWNQKRSALKNADLRRAVSYSLNRQSLVKNVLKDGSTAATSLVPTGNTTNPTTGKDFNTDTGNLYPYSPAKAKQYWKKAQASLGTQKRTLQLLTNDNDINKSVAEYIQAAIEKNLNGVTVNVKSVPLTNEISTLSKGNFDFATLSWSSDFQDPVDFLNKASLTNSVNFGKFHNAQYEKLIATITAGNQTTKARYQTMQQAAQLVAKEQGVTPIYQTAAAHLISKQVGGVHFTLLRDTLYRYAYWK
ncbi:peptide ABC transporter substrate-binding protein [Lactiplantibacillus paraplantarum]|mgnify:CR=1 FL=1|uniref:Peptide ABC transporter substrate-binding protein n=1 Tax=Lactiplantibacillus paraplantarum TaxID=60520 RepID=A0AAD0TL74_9LACO|nr:peptide ABC transporter substrate-binding protein [Lactiplantibacillus paraplantarum]AVW09054.1 peptide ABC transporter substrate-binding protein [Lactiplantibacillus paraplantarum]AYJ37319.1 peptide ABC transporter substrate-binding protein [Lactiplantibacillus paraplantarum]ERL45337.1 peptide binding protein OppA [Lactiplantibacillus paraplantarum]KRL48995.1 lipoprotein, peptide binding protein oppa like protein [Lactiplantibacillus paraplantarum DSM 10667]MCU4682265.1 peptide ABC transpo